MLLDFDVGKGGNAQSWATDISGEGGLAEIGVVALRGGRRKALLLVSDDTGERLLEWRLGLASCDGPEPAGTRSLPTQQISWAPTRVKQTDHAYSQRQSQSLMAAALQVSELEQPLTATVYTILLKVEA